MKQEIGVNSITYALKGKEVLEKHGYRVSVERKNRLTSKNGCGYKIVFYGDRRRAISILKKYNIKITENQVDKNDIFR